MEVMNMTRLTVVCLSFIVVSLMFVGISNANIDPKNCVGVWLFDEGAGNVAKDSSGNQHDGKLMNGSEWVDGKFGKALSFDGVDDYVEVPDSASLKIASAITIGAWIKLKTLGRFHGVMGKTGSIWSDVAYSARVINTNQYNFTTSSNGAACNELSGGTPTTDWHHVAYWFEKSTKRIYVDGTKEAETKWDGPIHTNNQNLSIGAYTWGNGLGFLMQGFIDEVGLFNIALSEDDIKSIMTKGLDVAIGITAVSPVGKLATSWGQIKNHQ
jgi:hypothetical protein